MASGDSDPTLNTRVPQGLLERIDAIYEERGFSNRSEFVRSALRDALDASSPLSEQAREDLAISRDQIERGRTTDFEKVLGEAGLDFQNEGKPLDALNPESVDAVGLWGTEYIENEPEMNIKVVGCGGAGSRLIGWLETVLPGSVETIAIDADKNELEQINADTKILLRQSDDNAGLMEDVQSARAAMEAAREQLEELLAPSDVVFLLTGLGGVTGTAIAPSVANAARRTDATVVCIATLPHELEAIRRQRAWRNLETVSGSVDTFALLDPAKFADYSNKTGVSRVFEQINRYIVEALQQLILRIDDFNMIQWDSGFLSFLDDGGFATLISDGVKQGEDVDAVVERLLRQSLVEVEEGAADRAILLMRGAASIDEKYVRNIVGKIATRAEHVAWVYNVDEDLSEEIRVTGIVTGLTFDDEELEATRTESDEAEEESLVFMSSSSSSATA